MELFKNLAALLTQDVTATIVIKKTSDSKMTVITNFSTEKGGVCDNLAPFVLKGSPEEMDGGFIEAIKTPVETVTGLVSNMKAFQESAKQAEKNISKGSSSKVQESLEDKKKKAEEERRLRVAETEAKKINFAKAIEESKTAISQGCYHTAEAFSQLAITLTDDKKIKADINKQIKLIAANKEGFLCSDNAEQAKETLDAFKSSMATAESILAQNAAEAAAPAEEPEAAEEEPQNIAALSMNEDDGEHESEAEKAA